MPDKDAETILECDAVWKIFGDGAASALRNLGPDPSDDDLKNRKLIAGVRHASLKVKKGEIFIIMGLSGSGKSTLLRCMTGLHDLTGGRVLIDGVNIADLSDRDLVELRRRKISMVFQDFALLPHLTVLGNVAFPLRVQGADRRTREEAARKMIALVGLEGRETYYPDELSGGQQQRVGIARSLTTQPEVWFLDEPFSALDPLIRQDMQSEFLRLQGLLKKTIVFVTHDFDEAVRLADRMAVMKDGRVVQIGKPEELILDPADDYVTKFTRDIPKEKVLRVRSIMTAGGTPTNDMAVPAEARLVEVAADVIAGEGHHPVLDASGALLGTLHRRDLAAYLI
ncbi:betaine/proline/choline family ABC transporter ATP-binding protein [Oricola sp.]|uniref:quaternary amine ABC transporter ATP-binding protein n=1 Tax=Oricola sp. TaxID=1979950 RepID=UPI0025D79352|nr:betaine/proline/choline family ABC transporter ATP-binding protein [Oricola sp.]MCI5076907.1 betaine/proline/choline family ABC transporter ATP-binding protein [Oricola sp.]